jgi:hypothetical protein
LFDAGSGDDFFFDGGQDSSEGGDDHRGIWYAGAPSWNICIAGVPGSLRDSVSARNVVLFFLFGVDLVIRPVRGFGGRIWLGDAGRGVGRFDIPYLFPWVLLRSGASRALLPCIRTARSPTVEMDHFGGGGGGERWI